MVIFSWPTVVTVCFREVSCSRSFPCGCTPIHPFVNTPTRKQSLRSGGPDTEYVFRPSRGRKGRLIHCYARLLAESMGPFRLALRREDLPAPEAGDRCNYNHSSIHAPQRVSSGSLPGSVLALSSCGLLLTLPGGTTHAIRLVVLDHVPDDRCQPTHHGHPGNLRTATLLNPRIPRFHRRIAS